MHNIMVILFLHLPSPPGLTNQMGQMPLGGAPVFGAEQ